MKKRFWFALLIGYAFMLPIGAQMHNRSQDQGTSPANTVIARIRITFNHEEIIVGLFDSPASRGLLAQLPLTLSFSDFASAEKIAYLPEKLTTRHTPTASQITGDFTYYAPWGNLAMFYNGYGHASGLYVLGSIESGKEKLAAQTRDFTATIERIE